MTHTEFWKHLFSPSSGLQKLTAQRATTSWLTYCVWVAWHNWTHNSLCERLLLAHGTGVESTHDEPIAAVYLMRGGLQAATHRRMPRRVLVASASTQPIRMRPFLRLVVCLSCCVYVRRHCPPLKWTAHTKAPGEFSVLNWQISSAVPGWCFQFKSRCSAPSCKWKGAKKGFLFMKVFPFDTLRACSKMPLWKSMQINK